MIKVDFEENQDPNMGQNWGQCTIFWHHPVFVLKSPLTYLLLIFSPLKASKNHTPLRLNIFLGKIPKPAPLPLKQENFLRNLPTQCPQR